MCKMAFRVAAVIALLIAIAGAVPQGPMHHGWDWPWHGWWHSGETLQHGWMHRD